MSDSGGNWLSPKEFGERVGLKQATIRVKCAAGEIPFVRLKSGRIRISEGEVGRLFRVPAATAAPSSFEDRYRRAIAWADAL